MNDGSLPSSHRIKDTVEVRRLLKNMERDWNVETLFYDPKEAPDWAVLRFHEESPMSPPRWALDPQYRCDQQVVYAQHVNNCVDEFNGNCYWSWEWDDGDEWCWRCEKPVPPQVVAMIKFIYWDSYGKQKQKVR